MVSPRSGLRKKTPEQLEQSYIRLRVMRQELEKLRLLVDLVKKRETLKQQLFGSSAEVATMMLRGSESNNNDE